MTTFITGCPNRSRRPRNAPSFSTMLEGKKILLGVTASIAAYKAAMLIRLLIKEGAEVQVIMTPLAREFITPVTLSALSGKPVRLRFVMHDADLFAFRFR